MARLIVREAPADGIAALTEQGLSPLMARVLAARGIHSRAQLSTDLKQLLSPSLLLNADLAAQQLAECIIGGKRLLIVADYDADGATACAVGLLALRQMGARVDYLVPNRFEFGYGLTPEIVQLAYAQRKPDVLITVDNGIASIDGVDEATRLGMQVVITDHHLPGDRLPNAWSIVNPNQPDCTFPSKSLAGVGVMFYVMLSLRAELRRRGRFDGGIEPNLADLLDLVALGTVADVVRLDDNNRILVYQGLQRIRQGRCRPGIAALLQTAKRAPRRAGTYDLGFVVGPRLNAAGRLSDMSVGIECLITDDPARAAAIAADLDRLNRERRTIEKDMQSAALARLPTSADGYSISVFEPDWHQGVIGILAARLREHFHRPAFAFAPAGNGELKGSGRSIPGLHLRDALDLVTKRHPDLILRFGGHAAAAGLSLAEAAFDKFCAAFEQVVREQLSPTDLERVWLTDGSLPSNDCTLDTALSLSEGIWGQGFPEPVFCDRFSVASRRVVGEHHLKLQLQRDNRRVDAMLFGHAGPLPAEILATYRLSANHYNGDVTLQLILEHWRDAEAPLE